MFLVLCVRFVHSSSRLLKSGDFDHTHTHIRLPTPRTGGRKRERVREDGRAIHHHSEIHGTVNLGFKRPVHEGYIWGSGIDPTAHALASWRCALRGWQDGIPGGGAPRAVVRGVWG